MRQKLPATPTISVIVATRNRRAALQQFLQGARLLPAEPAWELIVVDNGSSDGTDVVLASLSASQLPLMALEQKRPGKSRALNLALSHARGEILLFTDDDIVPERRWLSALHQAANDYAGANVFGGRIMVDQEYVPRWVSESYNLRTILTSEQDCGDDIQWFGFDRYPVGPNIAVRRRALLNCRCEWPVNLGPGTKIPLGDERAFLMGVSAPAARDRLYVPASIVHHNIGGRELKITRAVSRCFLGGYAAGLIDKQQRRTARRSDIELMGNAWQSYRRCASAAEFICSFARAAGVIAGAISPYPRIVFG